MKNEALFTKTDALLHGGDYNPEQWLNRPDILAEDIRLMKEAGVNVATLGVFAWSMYEPEEGKFDFSWMKTIMDNLYENGIYTILATPTGARPAWLDEAYPEAMRVSKEGVRNHHGVRHNHCMSSTKFREKVSILVRKLAENLGDHPGLLLWHISNELGGECYCKLCSDRFVHFLKNRYHNDIEELNSEWWTTFWSHRFNRFEQIEPPFSNGEFSIHGLNLDWKRFTTWSMTDYMKAEISILRELTPDVPITTNLMRRFEPLDYSVLSKELDLISWDIYPSWNNDKETPIQTANEAAFDHSILRSLKRNKPFLMMESVPSQVNWHPYNKLKRPGIHKLSCIQAVACGSDMVGYFQWRKSRGAFEQHHGAVVDHLGTSNTRVFQEVKEVGDILKKIKGVTGSVVRPQIAMIFDWNNLWAINDMAGLSLEKKYDQTCKLQYDVFIKNGIDMDVITLDADFSGYKILIAPMLYLLKQDTAARLKNFTANGGILIATYLTGYVNENTLAYLGGFPGDGLQELFGLYSEEIDVLYPTDRNEVRFETENISGSFEITDYCEIIKPKNAQVLAKYTKDFYAETPVVTRNDFGKGVAYYVAARIEPAGMEALYLDILKQANIPTRPIPDGVEYHIRQGQEAAYEFYLNFSAEAKTIEQVPEGLNLVTGELVTKQLVLSPYDVAVIEVKNSTRYEKK